MDKLTKETRVIDLTLGELMAAMSLNQIEENSKVKTRNDEDEFGGIEMAMEVTGLAKQTIYSLTSTNEIPFMRSGKKHLRFAKAELVNWLKSRREPTNLEIKVQAQDYVIGRRAIKK